MKVYKGWELLKAIVDNEVKEGTKIKWGCWNLTYKNNTLYDSSDNIFDLPIMKHHCKSNFEIEIIEEDKSIEELDIDKIYEFGTNKNMTTREFIQPIKDKINEIVKAVNGLKKESDK